MFQAPTLGGVREAWRTKKSDTPFSERARRALSGGVDDAATYIENLSFAARARLRKWVMFREPNWWYILFNGMQIAASLAVLVIGFAVLKEAREDLVANVGKKLVDTATSTVKPCGLPAPDMLHLLRMQGVHENTFGLPQLLEPDYYSWSVKVFGSLCQIDPYWTSDGADGGWDGSTENRARKVHILASMMSRRDLAPISEAEAELTAKETLMLNEFCRTDKHRVYSKRLDMAFGDPLTRISRAYLAAAPAFKKYRDSKQNSGAHPFVSCLGDYDPFAYTHEAGALFSTCGNADYVNLVLDHAGLWYSSSKMVGIQTLTGSGDADVLEQLVALYALSLINHIDKTDNNAACFGNTNLDTALQMCQDLYSNTGDINGPWGTLPTDAPADAHNLDIRFFRFADANTADYYKCSSTSRALKIDARDKPTVSPSPSPPPYDSWRGVHKYHGANEIQKTLVSVCASTMQYGLYDQERLFGVPDVLWPFQSDNRPDANFHFLGRVIPHSLDATIKDNSVFIYPGFRLELFLAYRLAGLTWWGSVIAIVTGFFIGRSATPFAVATLAIVLRLTTSAGKQVTIVQPDSRSVFQDGFTIFASVLAVVAGYYTLFVDPAALSYYPTTTSCDDFVFDGTPHSSGGAYVTSWGKRRFSRYSEALVGVVVLILSVTPLIFSITKIFVQTQKKKAASKSGGFMTKIDTGVNAVLFVACAIIVGAQAGNCANSGHRWLEVAKSNLDTTEENDTLQRDCLAQVLISFWVGLTFSVNRASWCVLQIKGALFRMMFFSGSIFLIWLVHISYLAILPTEYEDAFSTPTGDDVRLAMQVLLLTGTILFSAAVLVEWWSYENALGALNQGGPSGQDNKLDMARANAEATLQIDVPGNPFSSAASACDRAPLLGVVGHERRIPMLSFRL